MCWATGGRSGRQVCARDVEACVWWKTGVRKVGGMIDTYGQVCCGETGIKVTWRDMRCVCVCVCVRVCMCVRACVRACMYVCTA